MASNETVIKSMALLADTWPREQSNLTVEIFNQVMDDVDDGDLMVATMQIIRSGREFPPTPGHVRAVAKDILNERMRAERLEREQAARNAPAPTTRQIAHGGNSRLHEIPFNGDWEEYAKACQEQAAVEWKARASWCPGFDRYDYSSLGGKYTTKDGLSDDH